jgi:hypothetical protein
MLRVSRLQSRKTSRGQKPEHLKIRFRTEMRVPTKGASLATVLITVLAMLEEEPLVGSGAAGCARSAVARDPAVTQM